MISKFFTLLLLIVGTALVLESVDAAYCRQNEMLVPIAPNCEKTCNGGCSTRSKRNVIQRPCCICRPGFVRNGGTCVPFSHCNPPTSPPPCPTTCAPVTATPTCPPAVVTTPAPVTCPPVTTPVPCPTATTSAPCPTTPAPACAVTNAPPCQGAAQPCRSCGATTPCPCRLLVGFKFI